MQTMEQFANIALINGSLSCAQLLENKTTFAGCMVTTKTTTRLINTLAVVHSKYALLQSVLQTTEAKYLMIYRNVAEQTPVCT